MAGSRAFRFLQLGAESVQGTPVAATTIWRGMGMIKDGREWIRPQENVGIAGGTLRKYLARQWSELAMPEVEATYEQLPYIFEAGVAIETPSADGTGSGYIYNYLSPTTAQNTLRTYTIEGGDDQQAEEIDFAFVKHFNLNGEGTGALMCSVDWYGREATNTTKTPALSIPTVEEILVNNAKLYIDEPGGTIGSTEVSSTLFKVDLDVVTGVKEYWAVDGTKDFSLIKFTSDEALVLKLTYEHNASAVAEKANYRDGTNRLIRLLFEGSDLGTPGSTYSKKTMIWDLAAFYNDWGILDDNEGNDVVEVEAIVAYSDTDSLKADFTIVNELSALP